MLQKISVTFSTSLHPCYSKKVKMEVGILIETDKERNSKTDMTEF